MGSQSEPTDVVKVQEVLQRSVEGWCQLDAAKILSTVARRDDVFIWGTDRDETWIGFDAFADAVHEQVTAFENPSYEWAAEDPKIWVLGDAAFAHGELYVGVDSAGQRWNSRMRSTFVLQREGDEWVIVHSHYSVGQSDPVVRY